MYIRNTQIGDLSRVMEIYAYAREYMAKTGNPKQWGATNWPPKELIEEDIAKQRSYVCIHEDKVVGVFYFHYGHSIDATYDHIEGKWIGDENYGVVHRIAGDGSVKGIGRFCINWAFEQCGHLRIDTHGDNKVMQKLLLSMGFAECGIIYVVEDNDPRVAFEKVPQAEKELKYFVRNKDRVDTCYHEFYKGTWHPGDSWSDDSYYLHDEILREHGDFLQALRQVISDYDAYGVTKVTFKDWKRVGELLEKSDNSKEIYQELDVWVKKVFETEDCFTILGI